MVRIHLPPAGSQRRVLGNYREFRRFRRLSGISAQQKLRRDQVVTGQFPMSSIPICFRRRALHAILPASSTVIARTVSVTGRGHELFELMCSNDLEGIVAKRLADPYTSRVRWLKIKNRHYSQAEGRAELFNVKTRKTIRPLTPLPSSPAAAR